MKNNFLSMFYWMKNKRTIEKEHQKEDEQYNQTLTEIAELKKQLKNEIKWKTIYCNRCKRLRKKLNEHFSNTE